MLQLIHLFSKVGVDTAEKVPTFERRQIQSAQQRRRWASVSPPPRGEIPPTAPLASSIFFAKFNTGNSFTIYVVSTWARSSLDFPSESSIGTCQVIVDWLWTGVALCVGDVLSERISDPTVSPKRISNLKVSGTDLGPNCDPKTFWSWGDSPVFRLHPHLAFFKQTQCFIFISTSFRTRFMGRISWILMRDIVTAMLQECLSEI